MVKVGSVGLTWNALIFTGDVVEFVLLGNYPGPTMGLIWKFRTSTEIAFSLVL